MCIRDRPKTIDNDLCLTDHTPGYGSAAKYIATILKDCLLYTSMSIELLKRTPSSYLGSCRYKLPDPDVDSTPFIKLFTLFDTYDICAVFYIGCLLYTSVPACTAPRAM